MALRHILFDNDDLRLTRDDGTDGIAIVSFTGIGWAMGGIQKEEFAASIKNNIDAHTVFYVIDKKRSWYNLTHATILDVLSKEPQVFDEVITLGNSMGGFGALYFAGILPQCRRAIAFAPQFSVAPDTPERRWQEWIASIREWPVQHALENLSDAAPIVVVFGANEGMDQWHIAQFEQRLQPPHCLLVVPSSGHNAAATMKSHGILSKFIQLAIHGASELDLAECLEAKSPS